MKSRDVEPNSLANFSLVLVALGAVAAANAVLNIDALVRFHLIGETVLGLGVYIPASMAFSLFSIFRSGNK